MNRTALACTAIASGALLLSAGLLAPRVTAGPLDPPGGPVASSYKTLTEVEPRIAVNAVNTPGDPGSVFRIDQPGSYYLTGNITGVSAKHGIRICASHVTLDLMGFALQGGPGQLSLDGVNIGCTGAVNVAIVNGTVEGWGGDGIDAATATTNIRVNGVLVRSCADAGIKVGPNSIVTDCTAFACAAGGIVTGDGCTITGCTARANISSGIRVGASCTVSGCASTNNTGAGVGIEAGAGCSISLCTAGGNTFYGFTAAPGSTVSGCTARTNGGGGIVASNNMTISDCTVSDNSGFGILTTAGCTIIRCTSSSNHEDGIQVTGDCRVVGNQCDSNGSGAPSGAGIHATSGDNHIEGNSCSGNDRGIDVDAAGNIIIRNTCTGNSTNWDIVANNVCGPILDRTAPASALIFGNSAPDSTGSAHPNANFTY